MVQHPEKDAGRFPEIKKRNDVFCEYYQSLKPVVYLSYEREAYYSFDGSDFK